MGPSFLLAATLVALGVAAVAAGLLVPVRSAVEAAFATVLLGLALATLLPLGLGLVGMLRPVPIVLGSLALAAGLARAAFGPARAARSRARLAAVRTAARGGLRDLRAQPFALAVVLIATVAAALHVWLALRFPVADYDGLTFHAFRVDVWVRAGGLVHTPTDGVFGAWPVEADAAPGGVDLLGALGTTVLGRSTLADLVQLPFAALGGLAVVLVARAIGIDRARSLAAGALLCATPAVVAQLNTTYTDVAMGACVLAAFAPLATWVAEGQVRANVQLARTLLCATALGLALGAGSFGLVPLALAAVALVVLALVQHLDTEQAGRLVVAFAVPIVLLGSFWYLRNAVTYGNPVYPSPLSVAGLVLVDAPPEAAATDAFAGGIAGSPDVEAMLRSWISEPGRVAYDEQEGGLGLAWPWLMVPALLLVPWRMFDRRGAALFGAFGLPVALTALFAPVPWWARCTIALTGLGALAVVELHRRLGRSAGRLLGGAVVAAVLLSTVVAHRHLTFDGSDRPVGEVLAASVSGPERRELGAFSWEAFAVLQEVPAGAVVAVHPSLHVQPHAVIGDELERDLVHVGTPDDAPDLAELLVAAGADHLYAPLESVEDLAARRSPARFRRVDQADGWVVWAVRPEEGWPIRMADDRRQPWPFADPPGLAERSPDEGDEAGGGADDDR